MIRGINIFIIYLFNLQLVKIQLPLVPYLWLRLPNLMLRMVKKFEPGDDCVRQISHRSFWPPPEKNDVADSIEVLQPD